MISYRVDLDIAWVCQRWIYMCLSVSIHRFRS